MRFFLAAAICALILASGCAQNGATPAQAIGEAKFVLPVQDPTYHARYTVEEGAAMKKEAWRADSEMRTDLSVQGMRVLSFYFVGSRAYSCSFLSGAPVCYDITTTLSQADASKLMPREIDFSGTKQVESVKIGDTTGRCYEASIINFGPRKTCFAVGGVIAYDSYNVSKTLVHTEYLTSLEIYPAGQGPDASVFALPAKPISAPAVKPPSELQLDG